MKFLLLGQAHSSISPLQNEAATSVQKKKKGGEGRKEIKSLNVSDASFISFSHASLIWHSVILWKRHLLFCSLKQDTTFLCERVCFLTTCVLDSVTHADFKKQMQSGPLDICSTATQIK